MSIYFVVFATLTAAVVAGFSSRVLSAHPLAIPPGAGLPASPVSSTPGGFARVLYWMATALMVGVAGFRAASVGADYENYRNYFLFSPDTVGTGFFEQWATTMPFVDIAYVYLNSWAKLCGFSFEALVFLIALLAVTLYAAFFLKHTRLPALALMLYFSHAFLNKEMIQIRAGLASVLALWAFHYWASARKWLGGSIMLLGILTHMALVVAVIPLLLFEFGCQLRPRYVLATLCLALFIGYNLGAAFPLFSQIDRLALFQDTAYSTPTGIFSNLVTLKQFIILGIVCWLMATREHHLASPVFRLCVLSYWVATLWMVAFSQFQILGERGASFLWIGEPLILAEMVSLCYRDRVLRPFRVAACFSTVGFALAMLVLDLQTKEVLDDYTTLFQ